MNIVVKVVGQRLEMATNLKNLVAGTQQFIRFIFKLPSDWNGLTVHAQFIQNDEVVNAYQDTLDSENAIYLPSEIKPGNCIIVLYGEDSGDVRAVTDYLNIYLSSNMIVADAREIRMTDTVYNMIIKAVTGQELTSDQVEAIISTDVANIMQRYLDEGVFADIIIEDGSIARKKVDANFENTLRKADSAIQAGDSGVITRPMVDSEIEGIFNRVENWEVNIEDGSITRAKLDADLEATLAHADSAITPYDGRVITLNMLNQTVENMIRKADNALMDTDESVAKSNLAQDVQASLAKADSAMQGIGPKAVSRGMLDDSLNAIATKAENASQTIVTNTLPSSPVEGADYILNEDGVYIYYKYIDGAWKLIAGSQTVIDTQLPDEDGNANTDYYILNEMGTYTHYRWIDGEYKQVGGASTTMVITEFPETPIESVDYIYVHNGEYAYYKYIDGDWRKISGASGEIVEHDDGIDYYMNGTPQSHSLAPEDYMGKYYLDLDTLMVYTPEEVEGEEITEPIVWSGSQLIAEPSDTKDYYIPFENGFLHYRYHNNAFHQVGSVSYTREQIDGFVNGIGNRISGVASDVSELESKVNNLSNMVKDVTISQDKKTLTVTYANDATSTIELDTGIDIDTTRYNVDDDHKLHFYDSNGNELEGLAVEITGAGGGGVISGSVTIGRVSPANIQNIFGNECFIDYTVMAVDASGERVGDGTGTLYVNNVAVASGFTVYTSEEGADNRIDISNYLSVGTNTVKISVSVDTGGESNTVATKTWSVNAINMYLNWDYTDSQINTSAVTDYYTPYGALNKTIYTFIDVEPVGFNPKIVDELPSTTDQEFNPDDVVGINYFVRNGSSYSHYVYSTDESAFVAGVGRVIDVNSTTRSGVMQSLSIPMQSHGSHAVVRFMTGDVNGETISTATQVHDMVFVVAGETAPIVATSFNTASTIQYNTVQIPIVVYDPNRTTTTVILSENDQVVSTWNDVDRTVHYWNYAPTTAGTKTLTIRCGSTTKTIVIDVTELDITEEEVPGYDFRFKASEMATNSAVQAWSNSYTPVGQTDAKTVSMQFSRNFDWVNGGLHTEYDENNHLRQYFCVRAGTSVTINYNLFGRDYDPKQYGKNFKFIFKAVNCRTYDANVLTCMDSADNNNGVGLVMTANEATLTTANNSLKTYYYKDSYIEFETNIYPNTKYPYLQFWMDGSHDTTKLYDSSDSIQQVTPTGITIGSPNCDVYIYMIKAYPIYMSNDNEISNFIMDSSNAYDMVDRYNRNNILNANGEIDYQTLATLNPKLHVLCLDINRMSTGKKDNIVAYSVRHIYNQGGLSHCFTVNNACVTIQGTSSVGYLESAGNVDINFKYNRSFTSDNVSYTTGQVEFDDGTTSQKGYSMTDNSIPVDYMNVKVNVASSENANNANNADWYNTYQPWHSPARRKNPKARDTMEFVPGVIFIRDRSGDLFYTEQQDPQTGQTVKIPDTQNYHMYGICDIGNSKKNTKVFHDTSNPIACCMEVSNNTSLPCLMSSKEYEWNADDDATVMERDPETGELKEQKVFEFRYIDDDNSDTVKLAEKAWDRFVSFMVDYNPNLATNKPLAQPVTFGTYTFKGSGEYDTSAFDSEEYNVVYLYGYGDPAEFGYAASKYVTDTSAGATCYYYINYSNDQIYSSNGTAWTSAGSLVWTRDQDSVLGGLNINTYAKTYDTDSAEYRLAYMLNHCEEYMIMDPVVYHFVFIESFLMTDSVAKNTFWSSDDLVHWELSKNYDDDTSLGNDE